MLTQDQLVEEVGQYEPFERVKIVEAVLRNVMHPDPEIEQAWNSEASRRWEQYKQGDVSSIPYEDVMADYRKKV